MSRYCIEITAGSVFSLSNSQGGCVMSERTSVQRPEPPSHPRGEFIFYRHVYLCLARTEYVQNYGKQTKTKSYEQSVNPYLYLLIIIKKLIELCHNLLSLVFIPHVS